MKNFSFVVILLIPYFIGAQGVAINEVMGSNQTSFPDYEGDYEDWIELHNYSSTTVNLTGFGLSDDANQPFKWVFPNTTIAPGAFLVVWASGKNVIGTGGQLHTNFSISSSGEVISLTQPGGAVINEAPAMPFQIDVSIGRQPNGTGTWLYYYTATPNALNPGNGVPELVLAPAFSHESGLYSSAFELSLSHTNPNAIIVYTTDGSDPDLSNLSGSNFSYKNVYPLEVGSAFGPILNQNYISHTYSQPISLIDKSPLPDQITKKNASQSPHHIPPTPVRKGTVVKARAYINGIGSPIVGKTFFIWAQGNPYGIPVVSIIIPEKSMFDYQDGIYTAGVDFDTWRTNNPTNTQYWRPEWNNYWRSGMDWEYPIHFEVFSPNNFTTLVSQKSGMRIHGNNSRVKHIKNLRIYSRGIYDGNSNFDLPVFNTTIPFATNPSNTEVNRILLRPDGAGGAVFYDVAFNRLMQPIYEGVTRIEHAVHFINGEFWGLTAFRDRFDEHHYANYFDLTESNIVQIDCKGSNCNLDVGAAADYQNFINLRNFVNQNDMSVQSNFDQVIAQIDIRSFIDHMVLQIFSADNSYERFFWKAKVLENDNFGNGKWYLATQDFEAALQTNNNWLQFWSNASALDPNSMWFAKLLQNTGFRNQFINRYADLLNTAFLPAHFTGVIEGIYEEVSPYLAEDLNRMPRDNFYQLSEKNNLIDWANSRPASERNNLLSHFGLTSMATITLNVDGQNAGNIKVNTVVIEPGTPGVSQNPYPWNGIYYNGVPIKLTAIPNPGYAFSHWSGSVNSTEETIEFDPQGTFNLTAHFTQLVDFNSTVYFWFMGTDITNDIPLTSLSSSFAANLSAANLVYESCLEGYPFNDVHPMWRKASMERRNLPTSVNYRILANDNIPFEDSEMRAIQIKQPFQNNGLENTVILEFSTLEIEDIKVSLAAETDGAAEFLLFDYWDGQAWITNGLPETQFSIDSGYQLIVADFTSISAANNQAMFKVRIRFGGSNMTAEEGKRVHLNNIAVDGNYLSIGLTELEKQPNVFLYPNPTKGLITVKSDEIFDELIVRDMLGRVFAVQQVENKMISLNLQDLEPGVYWIQLRRGDLTSTVRFVKD